MVDGVVAADLATIRTFLNSTELLGELQRALNTKRHIGVHVEGDSQLTTLSFSPNPLGLSLPSFEMTADGSKTRVKQVGVSTMIGCLLLAMVAFLFVMLIFPGVISGLFLYHVKTRRDKAAGAIFNAIARLERA